MDEAPPDQPPSTAAKARLRASLRAQRADPDRDAVARASARVCLQLATLPEFTAATTVGLYWPTRGELDPNGVVDLPAARGVRFAWPHSNPTARSMRFHLAPAGLQPQPGQPAARDAIARTMIAGAYGILEPSGAEIAPEQLDLIVLPGLGFDRQGRRLGYGGGFYDRFLARVGARVFTVGVGFDSQLLERLPTDPHDQPVHTVVTPSELVRVDRAARGGP
ncbi:MAG: 5-formyltetrahydrofolate cyclo-ligase [Myxococcales bacterium]|nr:5-formyltetrahydrofolate cyclo-ligase [Myxococcales bacterium]